MTEIVLEVFVSYNRKKKIPNAYPSSFKIWCDRSPGTMYEWLIKVLNQKVGSRGWGAQSNISDRSSPTRASDYKPSKETVVR